MNKVAGIKVRDLEGGFSFGARVDGVKLTVRNERHAIRGRVIDGTGAPIADAQVVAIPVRAGAEPVFSTRFDAPATKSDDDGGFAIGDLPSG